MKITITILLLAVSVWNFSYGQGSACPNPKLTAAEQAAYQELIKARETAATKLKDAITNMEKLKKEALARANLRYVQGLNNCKDAQCSAAEKTAYDANVKTENDFYDKELRKAQGVEKNETIDAQDEYEEEIEKAKKLYPPLCMEASGQDGPTVYSGPVCDTRTPFEITGTNGPIVYPFKFIPKSDTTGTFSFSTQFGSITMKGDGTYIIKGIKTGTPRIEMQTGSSATLMVTTTGSGPAKITLTCK